MKTRMLFLFICLVGYQGIGQELFTLKKADVSKLTKLVKDSDNKLNEIPLYLDTYYASKSPKTNIKLDAEFNNMECGYTKKYASGIIYSIEQCGEASSQNQKIVFPKTSSAQMINWIEDIYKINPTEVDNIWYSKGLQYGPLDEGAGCYYSIQQTSKNTIVRVTCGC